MKAQLEEGTAIQHQRRPEDSLGEVSSQSVGFRELTGSKVWSLPLACFAALNARKCLLLFFFFFPLFFSWWAVCQQKISPAGTTDLSSA